MLGRPSWLFLLRRKLAGRIARQPRPLRERRFIRSLDPQRLPLGPKRGDRDAEDVQRYAEQEDHGIGSLLDDEQVEKIEFARYRITEAKVVENREPSYPLTPLATAAVRPR